MAIVRADDLLMKADDFRMAGLDGKPELVGRGLRYELYRVAHQGRRLVIKRLGSVAQDPRAIASLRHEFEVLSAVDLPGVAKVRELVPSGGTLALVMDDAGERNLDERARARKLSLEEFLEVATQLAEIVCRLHAARVVHRNISPFNVVWDSKSQRATLVDFAMATTLSALTVESASPSQMEGTLPYISPEQTGRTGRAVDSRSDLYSLGATFYELLAGAPPFPSADPIETIHAHLAKRPQPLHENAPAILSDLTLKLLEKEPERRYQTAEALLTDLNEAKAQFVRTGRIASFPLAAHDVPQSLKIPDKLYGRADEIHTLEDALARASAGERELILVNGAPGIGKSALVTNLERAILERRGFFIAGKFDQLQRGVPYSALVQAFRMLVRQLLAGSEAHLAAFRERIQAAISPNGQVLTELIPELERVIGPQAPAPELGSLEAKARLNFVFTAFLRVFARPEHPFAIFLDDLQWADAASLRLIEQWFGDADNRHLLLLGAWRDSEVDAAHPLTLSLKTLREEGSQIHEIHLRPLGQEDVTQLISESLNRDHAHSSALARLVMSKTGGNPFFVRRLLHALHASKLIRFAPQSRGWEWNLEEIARAPASDNVVELMLHSISRLPETTKTLLMAGACIGHSFDLATLSEITGQSRAGAMNNLWPALEDGLLIPLRDSYKAPRSEGPLDENLDPLPAMVQFAHDRVQQAAYSLLSTEARQQLHLQIGRYLLRGISDDKLEERLFDIVDQLDLAELLVKDDGEHRRLAELNLAAGRKAKLSAAYQGAHSYLSIGVRHLPANAWEAAPELAFALHRELAESAYLTGRHAEADQLTETALSHAPSKLAKMELYSLKVTAESVAGDFARALRAGRDGLALFNLEWPEENLAAAFEAEAAAVMKNLAGREIRTLATEPEAQNEEIKASIKLLSMLGPPAYFFDSQILAFVVTRTANLSLLHGPSPYSAYGYTFYGALHNLRTGDYETGYAFGRLALALALRFGNRGEEGRTDQVFGMIVSPWKAPLRATIPLFKEGYQAALESGELQYVVLTLVAILINKFPLGTPLGDFEQDIGNSLEAARRHGNKVGEEFTLVYRQAARCLTGRTRSPASFDDGDFKEAVFLEEAKDHLTPLAFYWIVRLQTQYLMGDFAGAKESAARAAKALPLAMGMIIEAEYVFYLALTSAALQSGELAPLRAKLTNWAAHCPENFRHKAELIGAEMARLAGDAENAARLYRAAFAHARSEGFVQDRALCAELFGRFLLAEGDTISAAAWLREAHGAYGEWGASAKARLLEEAHPETFARREPRQLETTLDTLSLIKASQAISAETEPSKLFERILEIAAQVAGAQSGALLLYGDGDLLVRGRTGERLARPVPLSSALDLPHPVIRSVARLKEPLVLADAAGESAFASDPQVRRLALRSVLCVPLKWRADVMGILYLENRDMAGAFTSGRVELVQVLAAQAAISLENSALLETKARAERSARFLASAGAALVESIDHLSILTRVAHLAVPGFADSCLVDLAIEDGSTRRIAAVHETPLPEVSLGELKEKWIDFNPAESGLCSLICVPLVARGKTLGFFSFITARSGRRYDQADLDVAKELARRSALAIENAGLFKDAQSAISIRDEFLSIASHELKTPITSLKLQLQMTSRKIVPEENKAPDARKLARVFQIANAQVDRLTALVEDLLDVSQIESGKLSFKFEPADLSEIVRTVVDRFAEALQAANGSVRVDAPAPVNIVCDRFRMEQVVINLLSNAMKYGAGKPVEISVTQRDVTARMSVRDSGIGIVPERQPRIFDRFERAVSGRNISGLGLGLYIVKQMVEAHGGTIRVASEVDKGSLFTIELPSAGNVQ